MPDKEAAARINFNKLVEAAGCEHAEARRHPLQPWRPQT